MAALLRSLSLATQMQWQALIRNRLAVSHGCVNANCLEEILTHETCARHRFTIKMVFSIALYCIFWGFGKHFYSITLHVIFLLTSWWHCSIFVAIISLIICASAQRSQLAYCYRHDLNNMTLDVLLLMHSNPWTPNWNLTKIKRADDRFLPIWFPAVTVNCIHGRGFLFCSIDLHTRLRFHIVFLNLH